MQKHITEPHEIIDESLDTPKISGITYEFPLFASGITTQNTNANHGTHEAELILGEYDISISNLPKYGETAEVTIHFTQTLEHPDFEQLKDEFWSSFKQKIHLEGLEFVDEQNVIVDKAKVHPYKPIEYQNLHPDYYYVERDAPVISTNETTTWTVTVKATDLGKARISSELSDSGNKAALDLYVSFDETLLYKDYVELYGEPLDITPKLRFTTSNKS